LNKTLQWELFIDLMHLFMLAGKGNLKTRNTHADSKGGAIGMTVWHMGWAYNIRKAFPEPQCHKIWHCFLTPVTNQQQESCKMFLLGWEDYVGSRHLLWCRT